MFRAPRSGDGMETLGFIAAKVGKRQKLVVVFSDVDLLICQFSVNTEKLLKKPKPNPRFIIINMYICT